MNGQITDMVLVGGGHSHLEVLRLFSENPPPRIRLTLVSRESETLYSGMLPGYLAGRYARDDCHIDLRLAARAAGCRFFRDEAVGIDVEGKRVFCRDRPPLDFDIASIDIGSEPQKTGISGAEHYGLPIRPIGEFLRGWEQVTQRALAAAERFRIVVVGAGAGGVETILALQHSLFNRFRRCRRSGQHIDFQLLSDADVILPTFNSRARRKLSRILSQRGIVVRTGSRVMEVRADKIRCRPQATFRYDALIWVTGPAPASWITESSLKTNEGGFILVDECLRSVSHPDVFAAGDIATMVAQPRPKSGVMAVRQGPPLAQNLRASAERRALTPFVPQRRFLSIVGTGEAYAVAAKGSWAVEGAWVWRWKEHIDRKWTARHHKLAVAAIRARTGSAISVAPDDFPATLLHCEKKEIPSVHPEAIFTAPTGRDKTPRRLLRQEPSFFRPVIDDPYLFGMLAAQHCLGRMFAAGSTYRDLHATVYVNGGEPGGSYPRAVIAGINKVMADILPAGLTSVTTCKGTEAGLLLCSYGFVQSEKPAMTLHQGQSLILTKPLGIGTLFAAERNACAKGRWIDRALDCMLHPNRAAAAAFAKYGATTRIMAGGGGLLEPLVNLCRRSGVDALLQLDALPALDGAAESARLGLTDPRHAANQRLQYAIANLEETRDHECFPLLFDPQLAGGILAAVPGHVSGTCLDALARSGYQAAIIGRITTGHGQAPVTLAY